MRTGDRVVKVGDGRAVPLGIRGTVEFTAGAFVYISWDDGTKCAVRSDGVTNLSPDPPIYTGEENEV